MMSAAARMAATATLSVRDVSRGIRTYRCRYAEALLLRRGHLPMRRPCMLAAKGPQHVPWSTPWHYSEGHATPTSVLASRSLYPSSLFTLHSLLFARPSVESATAHMPSCGDDAFRAACAAQHGGWRRALELLGDSGTGEQFNLLLDSLWRDGERLTACDQLLRACAVGAYHPQVLWTGGHLERVHLTGLSTGAALAAVAVWLAKIETLVVGDGIRRNPFLLPTEFVITLGDPMEDDDLSVAGGGTTSQPLARQAGDAVVTWLAAHDSPFEPFDEDHLVATQAAVSDWLLGLRCTVPGQPPRSAFMMLVAAATPLARPLKRGPPFAKS